MRVSTYPPLAALADRPDLTFVPARLATRARSKKFDTTMTVFPEDADWTALRAHYEQEHPAACEKLVTMSPEQIREKKAENEYRKDNEAKKENESKKENEVRKEKVPFPFKKRKTAP